MGCSSSTQAVGPVTHTGQLQSWEQLKPKILDAIKKDERPEVFQALLDDVRSYMEELKSTRKLAAISVQLQEDAAVFFQRRNILSAQESKKKLQMINNILKKQ